MVVKNIVGYLYGVDMTKEVMKQEQPEPTRWKPWVGLTEDDLEKLKLLTFEKEINAHGEEQEAVDLDQLMRATEQLCRERNT